MGEKKLHYKMYKDGKKFVFAASATLSFLVFGGVSTVAVHADTTLGNLTAATVNSTSDTKSAAQSAATVASSASDTKSFVQLMADDATAAYNSTPIDDATSTGFSVSDPDYPSGMWIDPDKSHYSYEWLQAKYGGNQIVLSTNRTGDGIVYVTELSPSNAVLKQYTLNQNTKVPSAVFDSTTYYNDAYSEMVESSRNPFAVKYIANKYDSGYYNRLSYFVPKLITQTTYYVDKDGK